MPCLSRRVAVDPLINIVPTLPSNLVTLNLIRSCNSNDISVSKLFAKKNKLILELHKVGKVNNDTF